MSLKIEGANSEVTKKIKGSEAKLLAKGKAKMPNAKEFKVKMRPNLVKASSGTFYGGHLYGTEDGTKWMKCAEVRIREGKEEERAEPVAPAKTETPKLTEEDIQRRERSRKRDLIEKKTKESVLEMAKKLEGEKNKVLKDFAAKEIFALTNKYGFLRSLFKPAEVKSLKVEPSISNSFVGGAEVRFRVEVVVHLPFATPDARKTMEKHGVGGDIISHIGFFHIFRVEMFKISNALKKSVTGLPGKNVSVTENLINDLSKPLNSRISGGGVDVMFVANQRAKISAWV